MLGLILYKPFSSSKAEMEDWNSWNNFRTMGVNYMPPNGSLVLSTLAS